MNWKSLTAKELSEVFKDIEFKTQPYHHQLVTFAFSLAQDLYKLMLIHDIGLGKTLTALYLIKLWKVKKTTLIICPNSVIKTWKEQIEKHTDFTYCILKGTKQQRLNLLVNSKAKLFIINYEGLKLIGGKKREAGGFLVDVDLVKRFPFQSIIIDESHHCKDSNSLQTKITRLFAKYSRYTILMTGTPIGKNVKDLFGQCLVLDNGLTFGASYNYFLNHFFYKRFEKDYDWTPKRICNICGEFYTIKSTHLKTHNINLVNYRTKYPGEKTAESAILDSLNEFSISYRREECLNLPEKIYEERSVYPTAEQQEWTQKIIDGLKIDEIGQNIEQHITKLLQITGGTIIYDNNRSHLFAKNPKLTELISLLEQTAGKIIIYHYYILEGNLIEHELKKKRYKVSLLNGNVKNKEEEIDKFVSGENSIMLAHPKSGGEGLNLQIANIEIFYSNAFIGTILRSQAEGRIYRTGQRKSCVFVDLVMRNTLDEVLFNALKQKTDYVQEILNYLRNKKDN